MGSAMLNGCSTLSVNYDYDNTIDFKQYKTYAWIPVAQGAPGNARTAVERNSLLDQRIRSAVDLQMSDRGFQPSESPDLHVVYHIGLEDKVQVTDWGYRYSDYYWGYGGRQIDVYNYKEGTLIVDVIEAESHNLIWRGSGTGVVDQTQRSPEEMQARFNEIMAEIMASFPPDGGGK